ncbi:MULTISPECIES: hypothetical protein [unclassified Roseofilum]|uniref:hypothetical protein n=1 Tax=unclassified Roseofilum TaxID=2620099 RepID=UPI000E9303D3|nr:MULTISPECIES: hypothetical protein [unclassified Roseofilum]MBP0008517.1 hypothetical protein [Roseofilum sp. Belize Diploria]MBP0032986.1 hypothetical protein [Roseofilum sp. Belize BBD 4]HBQ98034.1 hypothetical protein [Cyanobacteria bacterium UBA11691]
MVEFIVIVEARADAEIGTKLAERVILETIEWLDRDQLPYYFQWRGLKENTEFSCWKNLKVIIDFFKQDLGYKPPRFLGGKGRTLKTDGAAARKVLNLVRFLQRQRDIQAVLFIRDLDHQPERRQHLEDVRSEEISKKPKLEIIIGTPDRNREAWVLNGFIPGDEQERQVLEDMAQKLSFDPCLEAHKLRSPEPQELRNAKSVLEKLTGNDYSREQQCWEATDLEVLRERGEQTGLTPYLREIETGLIPIVLEG